MRPAPGSPTTSTGLRRRGDDAGLERVDVARRTPRPGRSASAEPARRRRRAHTRPISASSLGGVARRPGGARRSSPTDAGSASPSRLHELGDGVEPLVRHVAEPHALAAAADERAQVLERRLQPRRAGRAPAARSTSPSRTRRSSARSRNTAVCGATRRREQQQRPRVAVAPRERLQRDRAPSASSPRASSNSVVVVAVGDERDGVLERLVGEQRRGPSLSLRQRPQSLERLLELGVHASPASSSYSARAAAAPCSSATSR